MESKIPKPTERQQKQADDAVDMMLCIQMLNYAYSDLEDYLRENNLFRHRTKRFFQMVEKTILESADLTYEVMKRNPKNILNHYTLVTNKYFSQIEKSINVKGLDRYANILLALIHIANEKNAKLDEEFRFVFDADLMKIETKVNHCLEYKELPIVKTIISNIIATKLYKVE